MKKVNHIKSKKQFWLISKILPLIYHRVTDIYIASGLQRVAQWAKALQSNQKVLCSNPTKRSTRLREQTLPQPHWWHSDQKLIKWNYWNWLSEAVPSIILLMGSHLQTQSKRNFLQIVAFQACFNSSSEIHALVIFQNY